MQACFDETRLGHFPWDEGVNSMIEELARRSVVRIIAPCLVFITKRPSQDPPPRCRGYLPHDVPRDFPH